MAKKNEKKQLKLTVLYILKILQDETSEYKTMTATMIQQRLFERFEIELERKAVAYNLNLLHEYDESGVECSVTGEKRLVKTDWHYKKESLFEKGELIYLAEAVIGSYKIPSKWKKDLIEKLSKLSDGKTLRALQNISFVKTRNKGGLKPLNNTDNQDFFHSIELIHEAMDEGLCICFHLGEHHLNGSLFYAEDDKPYIVEPRFVAVQDGRYYLVGVKRETGEDRHFRVDMILDMEIYKDADENPVKASVKAEPERDAQSYFDKHLYAYGDPIIEIKMRVRNDERTKYHLFDYFGSALKLKEDTNDKRYLRATVCANPIAIKAWAVQQVNTIEIIEPEELRNEIRAEGQKISELYR